MLHSQIRLTHQSAQCYSAHEEVCAHHSTDTGGGQHDLADTFRSITRAFTFTAAFAWIGLAGCSDSEPLPTISVQAPQPDNAESEQSEPVVTSDIIEFAGIRKGQTLSEVNATLIPLAQRLFCTQISQEGHDRLYECGDQKILVKLDGESKVTWVGPYQAPSNSIDKSVIEAGGLGVENPASFESTPDPTIHDASPPRMVDDFLGDGSDQQPGSRAASVLDADTPFWIEIPLGDGR